MTDPTPEQHARLTEFYKEWRTSQERVQQAQAAAQLAQNTLAGAQADDLGKQARFKGAAEFVFGTTEVAFDYDEKSGKLTFRPASVPPPHGPGKRAKKGRT